MSGPIRLTAVLTHPVQYYAPWFRYIAAHCPEIDLTVLYAAQPTSEQQGVGFSRSFQWDVPLTDGYRCRILRSTRPGESVDSNHFWGLDVPGIGPALLESCPDVTLIPGWHSITLLRALWACRHAGIPALYRGDTNLGTQPMGWRNPLWTARTWLLLRLYSGYLAAGTQSAVYLRRFDVGDARIFRAPHAVDNAFFSASAAPHQTVAGRAAARERFGLASDDFVVVFAGKLEPKKRPLDLVRAMARIRQPARLLIVGGGELAQACRQEAQTLGVSLSWAGVLNQSELGAAYAAADCLALPSDWGETWGLVVNEAMATGLPCVASDRVGCAPDMVTPGQTGEIFLAGDVSGLAASLERLRGRLESGQDLTSACRRRASQYSFEMATAGLLSACRAVLERRPRHVSGPASSSPRVLACCGGMVIVSGLERLTFEVLRVLREAGAAVHCVVNTWEAWRVVGLVEGIGATWSTGYYWYQLERRLKNPVQAARIGWDIVMTSRGLLRDARRFKPTHVFVPDYTTALRNGPALWLLRRRGVSVLLRVANHPEPGPFYAWIWGRLLPKLVTRFVANSTFSARRLTDCGVPDRQITTIHNTVAQRTFSAGTDADVLSLVRSRRTALCVGQIAPFKGTHLAVEAVIELLGAGEDIQLVVVGAIPNWPPERASYAREIVARVNEAGYENRIRFVGERENVLEIMRAAFILVTPILQEETFGNVVLEAKSVGLPCVGFATGGIPEIVEDRVTGYLCRDRSVDGLLKGLRFFLEDPTRRETAAAACLASLERPDSEYSRREFERKWRALCDVWGNVVNMPGARGRSA